MPIIPVDEIEAAAARALSLHGARDDIAATMADATAWAEARGNRVCGLYYLESYCLQLRSGRVRGDVDAAVERPRPSLVRVDARDGFAQPAFRAALPVALDAARATGAREHRHPPGAYLHRAGLVHRGRGARRASSRSA